MSRALHLFLFIICSIANASVWAQVADKIGTDKLLTHKIVFESHDFMILQAREPAGEVITLREWTRDSIDNTDEPNWDDELFADRYQLFEVFGFEKQKLIATFKTGERQTALIESQWSHGLQYELETSVRDRDKIYSIVWAFQSEKRARLALERYQDFAKHFSDTRAPASAKKSKTEADYCLFCDVNLFEDPVRAGLAKIQKSLAATCKPDPKGGVSAKKTGQWLSGCVKGLATSVTSILKLFYELSNFTVKMTFNSRYQQKVADGVGSAVSAFLWHPIQTLTKMYKTVESAFVKESINLAKCGTEYRAHATCQLFGEIVSGGLLIKSIKKVLGLRAKNPGLHRIADTKYKHPIRKKAARVEARRLANAPTTRALIATAIIDQENPHLKSNPKPNTKTKPRPVTELRNQKPTIADNEAPFSLRLQSSQEYLTEFKKTNPKIETISREDFVRENSKRQIISDDENLKYIERKNSPRPPGSRTYAFRDSDKKGSNNTYGFDHSTAITTSYVDRVAQKVETLRQKYKNDIDILRYEGSNRLEVDVQPLPGRKVPATLDQEMAAIFKQANAEHHLFLKNNNLVRATDNPIENFKFAAGADPHAVDLTFRANKNLRGQLATHSWESPSTQANLKTIFMAGQEAHLSIQQQYRQTKIFDQKTGRINPRIADIISKSDTPEILIEKLKPYHQFRDRQGRLLPKNEQLAKADELMEYIDYTKVFGVEYRGIRTMLDLDNSNTASFGSDLTGQNGRNISHNTTVFDANFEDVVATSTRAEEAATREFRALLDTATTNRAQTLENAGYKVDYQAAGDDIEMIVTKNGQPVQQVPHAVRRALGNCIDGLVCLRDTYKPAQVHVEINGRRQPFTDKKGMDDITHKLEKDMRPILSKISTDYDQRNIWIDITPDGRLKLNVSHPPTATPQELTHYQRLEKIARRKFKKLVESADPDFLRGFRADPE